ncbi:hypothetical protein [Actinosynnema sp. NPDC020468]|uniref:hypothetical protein n=1 Tax=Actinosynnema sp. NPDC020468 TaxID=3154488 RepID=UPI0033C1C69E
MTEQRRSMPAEQGHDIMRRIQRLVVRAERTAFDHSNLVGPPPSQEHLAILAELRALTQQAISERGHTGVDGPAASVPRQAESTEQQPSAPRKPLAAR